jgi:hypothetical protein
VNSYSPTPAGYSPERISRIAFHNGISQFGRTIPIVHHLFMIRFLYCRPGGEAAAIVLGVRLS